jgi:UDP-N-acetyl-2-amino-2-deoxyglucuronate dehydrogenase
MYRFGIIGCGEIAAIHAKAVSDNGELVAVCDIVEEKAMSFAKTYNCKSYTSIDDLLLNEKDIDIITICSPNGLHAEHVIKSVQAGKHVMCELPLCITSAAAWQMIETAKFSRKEVFIIERLRDNATLKELKKQVDEEGAGGEIKFSLNCGIQDNGYFDGWRGKQFPGGGILYTAFANYLDVVAWLFGDAAEVTGMRKKEIDSKVEGEDGGSILVHFKGGAVGSIEWTLSNSKDIKTTTLEITGSRVNYSLRGELLEERILSGGDVLTLSENYDLENPDPSYNNAYQKMIEMLKNGERSLDLFEGMQTVTLIEKIYKDVSL